MKSSVFAFLVASVIVIGAMQVCHGGGHHVGRGKLKALHYRKSCGVAETTVKEITESRVAENPSLAAKLLRLHYHDCFVRGCDASILLDSTTNNTAEKSAPPNLSLAGYEVIDEIKAKLEEKCPETVSCADILALAARDAVSFQFNRPMWPVLTGRKDGRRSVASEAISNLPAASANFTSLQSQFASKGLDLVDLVALSGAHTIGVAHCGPITRRLYNFTGKGDSDPSINKNYLKILKKQCTNPPNRNVTVEMDPESSLKFNSHYYVAVKQKKGLFGSDAALLTNNRSAEIVTSLQNPRAFISAFASSMKHMGAIEVLLGSEGEIRKNCRVINA